MILLHNVLLVESFSNPTSRWQDEYGGVQTRLETIVPRARLKLYASTGWNGQVSKRWSPMSSVKGGGLGQVNIQPTRKPSIKRVSQRIGWNESHNSKLWKNTYSLLWSMSEGLCSRATCRCSEFDIVYCPPPFDSLLWMFSKPFYHCEDWNK